MDDTGIVGMLVESPWVGEVVIALVVGWVGWVMKTYLARNAAALEDVKDAVQYLTNEFHSHRVSIERRVTRVETKVDIIHQDTKEDDYDDRKYPPR